MPKPDNASGALYRMPRTFTTSSGLETRGNVGDRLREHRNAISYPTMWSY
jgi:hypothetical protein